MEAKFLWPPSTIAQPVDGSYTDDPQVLLSCTMLQLAPGALTIPDPSTNVLEIFSTRIKDAGIAIHHSRGRILFYTAGSSNGLEGLDGNGPRIKFIKKEFQIMKKGFASFQTRQKTTKTAISQQLRIQITHF